MITERHSDPDNRPALLSRFDDGGHGTLRAVHAPIAAIGVNLAPGKFGFGQFADDQDGAAAARSR